MVDTLKNFMSTMANAIMQQVSEQAASSAKPFPRFIYVPTMGSEPSHMHDPVASHRHNERVQEAPHVNEDRRSREVPRHSIRAKAHLNHHTSYGRPAKLTTASTPYATHSRQTAWPPPMTSAPKPQNARKYCEFHEQNGYTTAECRELRKALYELADKGQIFEAGSAKASLGLLGRLNFREPSRSLPLNKGEASQSPPWCLVGEESSRFISPHTDPLVLEIKVASAIVRKILIDAGSSVDIITWDCLKKLTYSGRDIVPLVHPILGHQDLAEKFHALLVARLTALLFALGRLLNPRCSLSLSPYECSLSFRGSFFSASQVAFSSLILSQQCLYLTVASSNLRRSDMAFIAREEYIPPTSAIATSSSATLMGSEVPEATKSYDLARS
ncbi:hypothetical protein Cgig2_006638 [Carnegiea gigantea]|uniref:Gag-pol polyprotein n=1 Tax=Carnegiea gigantea TaxID=171969 RepID=A0A9Q1JIJ1_9CARY|nr:hypothetical protein Cgig2_006638 [Carnegiea gigantea]